MTEKIRVGPIGPEQRRAIDAQMVRLLVQHRIVAAGKLRRGARRSGRGTRAASAAQVSQSTLSGCEPTTRAQRAARARKEAANVADQVEVRFLEAYAAGTAATERVAAV